MFDKQMRMKFDCITLNQCRNYAITNVSIFMKKSTKIACFFNT